MLGFIYLVMIKWINPKPEYFENFMLSANKFNYSWIFKTFQVRRKIIMLLMLKMLANLPPIQKLQTESYRQMESGHWITCNNLKVYLHFLSVTLQDQLLWLHDDEGSHTSAIKYKEHFVSYNVRRRTILLKSMQLQELHQGCLILVKYC